MWLTDLPKKSLAVVGRTMEVPFTKVGFLKVGLGSIRFGHNHARQVKACGLGTG